MATMTMNKAIHCAVRRDLRRFLDASEHFPDGDVARAGALGLAWDNFDAQLTDHHEGEHEIAWPAVMTVGIDQATIDTFDSEHDTMAAALATARGAMDQLRTTASASAATTFHEALVELQRATETHLAHEESILEPLLLENENHPAIKEMGKKFSKVPIGQAGTFFAWVLDGAEPEARAGIEGSVPKPVLAIIGGLFGRGYRRTVAPVWRT